VPNGPGAFAKNARSPVKQDLAQTKHPGAKHFPLENWLQEHLIDLMGSLNCSNGSMSLIWLHVEPLQWGLFAGAVVLFVPAGADAWVQMF
jgi:hypothetical protein